MPLNRQLDLFEDFLDSLSEDTFDNAERDSFDEEVHAVTVRSASVFGV